MDTKFKQHAAVLKQQIKEKQKKGNELADYFLGIMAGTLDSDTDPPAIQEEVLKQACETKVGLEDLKERVLNMKRSGNAIIVGLTNEKASESEKLKVDAKKLVEKLDKQLERINAAM